MGWRGRDGGWGLLPLLCAAVVWTSCGDDSDGGGPTPPGEENAAPEASFTATPSQGDAPLMVRFDASASHDTDGEVAAFAWTFDDGGTATGVDPTHTYTEEGTYTVTLTVTDDAGASDTATRIVTVTTNGGRVPPEAVFTATPTDGDVPLTVMFDATASTDPDGSIAIHDWDFGDGEGANGPTVNHTFDETGVFEVTLTVFDNSGSSDTATVSIRVGRDGLIPPEAHLEAAGRRGFPPLVTTFDASASFGAESDIVRYDWDFGDGQTAADGGPMVDHTYPDPGSFEASVTITDDQGLTDSATVTVDVYEGGPFAIPGRVEVEWYKPGGPDVGFFDGSGGNNGGAYRDDDVDIGNDDNASGGHFVGWIEAGEWLAYDVVVDQTGTYVFTAAIGSGTDGTKTAHIEIDGVDVSGPMNFDFNEGYRAYMPVTATVDLTEGAHELRFVMDTAGYDIDYLEFALEGGGTNNGGTNNGTTGTNNGTTGTNNGTTSTNNGTTSTNNGTTSTNNGTTSTNNGTATTNNGTATTNNGTTGT